MAARKCTNPQTESVRSFKAHDAHPPDGSLGFPFRDTPGNRAAVVGRQCIRASYAFLVDLAFDGKNKLTYVKRGVRVKRTDPFEAKTVRLIFRLYRHSDGRSVPPGVKQISLG